jgi:starch synthase (maltosyl-transferring)
VPARKTDRRFTSRRTDYLTIECVAPELDAGRHPVKRTVGDLVWIGADIHKEGHDLIGAQVVYKGPDDGDWSATPLHYDHDSDRWYGGFRADRIGRWSFSIEAWTDVFGTWRSALKKKVDAGQNVDVELLEGAQILRAASRGATLSAARATLFNTAKVLESRVAVDIDRKIARVLDDEIESLVRAHARRRDLTRYHRELFVTVDRPAARFASWYEMFPRSAGDGIPPRHGTFEDAAAQLPRLAELGFDVVYLPPVHPIGHTFRKGKNNTLVATAEDVGSPWAIGNSDGGHTAVEPRLGTLADFDSFVRTAADLGLEVALDYALQCSPDHPWVKEHPDWFHVRPDGTIKYAENPPKKYQDIYPLNFWCADRANLWAACRDIFLFWIRRGVSTFRVDNPHTKPSAFWEWVIQEVQRDHPDVVFFSEAFTRPKRMDHLAKIGFTMSYTYFTWKNAAWDLREYFAHLTQSPMVEHYRANLFTNTPDILNDYLVQGGRAAFRARLLLAATLSPLYGVYSGFELMENTPAREGSEEYLNSEKYELRPRDWDAPNNINNDLRLINRIRRENCALQRYANLTFHTSENAAILFYRKAPTEAPLEFPGAGAHRVPPFIARQVAEAHDAEGHSSAGMNLLIAVNTDPHHAQETMVHVPIHEMGIGADQLYVVHDLLTGARYVWRGVRNYIRLDPSDAVGHVFRVESLA